MGFFSGIRGGIGNAFDSVGTMFGAPELGISEKLAGGNTVNTYRPTGTREMVSPSVNTQAGMQQAAQPQQQAPFAGGSAAPAYGGGGGASRVLPQLNMGAINNTQMAIDQIPGLLQAALEAEAVRAANARAGFDAQERGQRATYDKSTMTNQQNYDANYMDSIRAGIKGLGGLFNILRGTGAGGGTAEDLVADTVGGVTANDIRTGADTQQANQTQLDSSLSTFLTDLRGKRQALNDTEENNRRAIQRDSQSQLQDLYGKMAGYYGDAERTADANNWMARAGSLTPSIAANSRSQQSRYDTAPVSVKAPTLTAFSAPSQPNVTVTPENAQIGSGIFTMSRRREAQDEPMAQPMGA